MANNPGTTFIPTTTHKGPHLDERKVIIAASCVAGAVLLAAIIAIIMAYRKHTSPSRKETAKSTSGKDKDHSTFSVEEQTRSQQDLEKDRPDITALNIERRKSSHTYDVINDDLLNVNVIKSDSTNYNISNADSLDHSNQESTPEEPTPDYPMSED